MTNGDEADRVRDRERDATGRAQQQRPRDALGRPLPHGSPGVPPVPEQALPPQEALDLARSLVAEGRAFGAHEVLEARWKATSGAERDLWQGLAQLCVGLTHAARGNDSGACELLIRGADRLANAHVAQVDDHGLDLPALIAWAHDASGRIPEAPPPIPW